MTADKKIEQLRVKPVGVRDDLLHLEPWLDVEVVANMTGLQLEIQQANPLAARLPADIWVLHQPLHGYRDFATAPADNIGSKSLRALYDQQAVDDTAPIVVVSGHVHEARGIERGGPNDATLFVNPGPLSQLGAALITLTGRTAEAGLILGE